MCARYITVAGRSKERSISSEQAGASSVPTVDEILRANDEFVADFPWGDLSVHPRRQVAILTCMDSRYTGRGVTGLEAGDAHTIRNAGGRATDDALRSLILSASLLGTRCCLVIHHTNCGLYLVTNDYLRDEVARATGERPPIDFRPFDDIEASVLEDLATIRACPYLPPDYEVHGFVYDVRTGRLTPVELPAETV